VAKDRRGKPYERERSYQIEEEAEQSKNI